MNLSQKSQANKDHCDMSLLSRFYAHLILDEAAAVLSHLFHNKQLVTGQAMYALSNIGVRSRNHC